jgi:ABC-type sugar transport system ATPase subunit
MKLVLKELNKAYGNKVIGVENIDIEIADGQMAVLLGPSGCGKTTLLRLISGLESPDSGQILLDGNDISSWEPKERDIAMVFQNYALYPHMTVRQNLEFGLKSRKIEKKERDESVGWAADLLGIADLLNRRPKELSGGQRQRVALGRAIVRRPRLYLYDEPLSNLDAELRMRMRGEILSLHRRVGGTSIYVTHDQVEAMSLADIIFIMRNGKLVASGTPKEMYGNPPDLFTAGFLGFPSMNLIDGTISDSIFISEKGTKVTLKIGQAIPNRVVLGIRPEDIEIADDGPLSGEIITIENLGRQELLLVKTGADDRLKLVGQGSFKVGDRICFAIKIGHTFLFNKASALRL